jgi:hypothetical protein
MPGLQGGESMTRWRLFLLTQAQALTILVYPAAVRRHSDLYPRCAKPRIGLGRDCS